MSRDPNDLRPALRERWEWMRDEWARRHPGGPQPLLTCTFRDRSEQAELVRTGRSNARPGTSLHNFVPSLAFDIAFQQADGTITWEFYWYELWGNLAESIGLVWGGRFPGLVDGPHIQWPCTWQEAAAGNIAVLPPLPAPANPVLPVATLHVMRRDGTEMVVSLDPIAPARIVGAKLYANEASA